MNKDNLLLAVSITLCLALSLWGYSIIKINKSNSRFLNDKRSAYSKLLKDPSIKNDGTTLIGTQFYNFSLKDIHGNPHQLESVRSLFKMVILFDINDCILCLNEYILWSKLNELYPLDKLAIFGICSTRERQSIINFINDRKIKFRILWDPERTVKNNMRFRTSPLRILLDNNNNIIDIEYTQTTIEHQQYIISMVDSLIMKSINK